ncbi:MAG: lipopolysaccharide heptosyltransferase II [Candidatus Brocadiia bacterium]
MPRVEAERIVVRAPNWVGDVVMATPAFRAVREAYPGAHLAVALRPYVQPILTGAPWFDEVIAQEDRGLGHFAAMVRRLRQGHYHVAVLLPNSLRTALEVFAARVPRRLGYDRRHRWLLLTDPIAPPRDERGKFQPTNMVDYYLGLCRHLGCQNLSRHEELFVTDEAVERAEALLQRHGVEPEARLAGLNPGAAFGSSKLWPAERFAAVGDGLAQRGYRVAIFGSPAERPIAQRVAEAMDHQPIVFEPGALDLDVLKPLIRGCSLLVTNDTGARHVAVAFGVPVVCIMGPTSPRYTDVNLERQKVVRVDVGCGPCQEKVCREDHRCMTRITPEMVLEAADDLLAGHEQGHLPP